MGKIVMITKMCVMPYKAVLDEAKEKFPGVREEYALSEYYLFHKQVERHSRDATKRILSAYTAKFAGELFLIYTERMN